MAQDGAGVVVYEGVVINGVVEGDVYTGYIKRQNVIKELVSVIHLLQLIFRFCRF